MAHMQVTLVDERDAQLEMRADGFRVFVVHPGRRVTAYNVDAASVQEAFTWATEAASGAGFSLAARFDQSGGGVALMYLTPPPEIIMEQLGD